MGKYTELLKKANENNINITELYIADNVVCDVMNSINEALKTEEEIDELIESICELVKWFYLKSNGMSISDISSAVCELHFDELIPLNELTKNMVYDLVISYHL